MRLRAGSSVIRRLRRRGKQVRPSRRLGTRSVLRGSGYGRFSGGHRKAAGVWPCGGRKSARAVLLIEEHASPLRPIEFQKLYDVHSSGGIRSQYRNDGPDLIDVVEAARRYLAEALEQQRATMLPWKYQPASPVANSQSLSGGSGSGMCWQRRSEMSQPLRR